MEKESEDPPDIPGGSQRQSGTTTPTLPNWLDKLLKGSGKDWQTLQKAANPMLQGQLAANPEQIAQLSPEEQKIIDQISKGTFGSDNPDIQSEEQLLSGLTSGPIGSSPDTSGD